MKLKRNVLLGVSVFSMLFFCPVVWAQEVQKDVSLEVGDTPSTRAASAAKNKRETSAAPESESNDKSSGSSSQKKIPQSHDDPEKNNSETSFDKLIVSKTEAEGLKRQPKEEQIVSDNMDGADDKKKEDSTDLASSNPFLKKLKKKTKRRIKARMFAHYELSDKRDAPNHFELGVARVNFYWSQGRVFDAVLKYDFANLIDGDEVKDGLKDAYLRLEPVRWAGVQVGQFKKPFSRIELTSRKKLPSFSRGESNDYISDFLHYGDRDLGVMLSGRLVKKIKLDYAAGVFNGGGPGTEKLGEGSKDVAFRLDLKPTKWLGLGASASARIIKEEDLEIVFDASDYAGLVDNDFPLWLNPEDQEASMAGFVSAYPWLTGTHWMGEIDAAVEFGGFGAMVEMSLGENWWFEQSPYLWSVATIMSYQFSIAHDRMAIEPTLMAESMHIEDASWTWRVRLIQVAPGVNVHFGKNLRLMIHGEWIKTTGTEADIDEAPLLGFWPGEWPGAFVDSKSLYVQLGFAN